MCVCVCVCVCGRYALELGKKGLNLLLISRTQTNLDDVATEIKKGGNVGQIKARPRSHIPDPAAAQVVISQTLAIDFSTLDDAKFTAIEKALGSIQAHAPVTLSPVRPHTCTPCTHCRCSRELRNRCAE